MRPRQFPKLNAELSHLQGFNSYFFSGPRGGIGSWENFGEEIWACSEVMYVKRLFSCWKKWISWRKHWFSRRNIRFSRQKFWFSRRFTVELHVSYTHAGMEKFCLIKKLSFVLKILELIAFFSLTKYCLKWKFLTRKSGRLASRQDFVSRQKCKKLCLFGRQSKIIFPWSHRILIPQQGIRHMSEKWYQTELL